MKNLLNNPNIELVSFLENIFKLYNFSSISRVVKYTYKDKFNQILEKTNYLVEDVKLTERIYHILNNLTSPQKCYCGSNCKFISFNEGYTKFCCRKCSNKSIQTKEKIKKTNVKKFGVENPMKLDEIKNKIKLTNLKKFGVEYPMKLVEIKNKYINSLSKRTELQKYNSLKKYKETCNKNFGIDNVAKIDFVKKKKKIACLNKYGVDSYSKTNEFKEKIKQTCLNNYGVDNPSKSEVVKEKISKIKKIDYIENKLEKYLEYFQLELLDDNFLGCTHYHNWKCKICSNEFNQMINSIQGGYLCPGCYPRLSGKSLAEVSIVNFIKEHYNDEIILNSKKIINPKELDIFIPKKNIAFEYNGLWYHSDEHKDFDKNGKFYHLNKTIKCEEQGIQLIHIFEDEWIFKQDIVKARIKQILGVANNKRIHARKCIIKEIEPCIKNEFLEKYHIQGKDSSVIKLGAYYQDELISVMTFSKGNISKGSKIKKYVWELNRFCSNSNYHIPGIASKLLTYFKRNYKWKDIFSYADRRWSDGNVYYQLGFNLVGDTGINYWYVKDFQRIHRFNLRRDKETPKELTEQEWRVSQGYSIIYDCGSLKFNLTK